MARPLDVTDIDRAEGKGGRSRGSAFLTPTPDAFTGVIQAKKSYLTTRQFAEKMRLSDKTVHRWCTQWYGQLPPARDGRGMGYRIHPFMDRVARGWLQTHDRKLRGLILSALRDASRPWVVIVDDRASTHYTAEEALEVAHKASRKPGNIRAIHVLYVGDPHEDGKEHTDG